MAAALEKQGIAPTIIYMSGYTDDASVRDSATRKGGLFLQKPFTGETLAVAVRGALDAIPAA
jgi:FixJ family two-component response regulator